jgi:hydroxyacylglutathione hydrolase
MANSLSEVPDLVALDVHGPGERASGCIEDNVQRPMEQLGSPIGELDPVRPLVVWCVPRHGSSIAARMLRTRGFDDVADLIDGCQAWAAP